jgi:hypothetical protein
MLLDVLFHYREGSIGLPLKNVMSFKEECSLELACHNNEGKSSYLYFCKFSSLKIKLQLDFCCLKLCATWALWKKVHATCFWFLELFWLSDSHIHSYMAKLWIWKVKNKNKKSVKNKQTMQSHMHVASPNSNKRKKKNLESPLNTHNILPRQANKPFSTVETTSLILVSFKLKFCWKKLFALVVTNIVH